MCLANQLNLRIAFCTWHEVIDIDKRLFTADTVYTTYALHQASGVPRSIIVQNNIGTVEVHTFSQDLCCNDNIVVILPDTFVIGIEIFLNRMFHLITIGSSNDKCLIALCLYRSRKRLYRVYSFREDNQFSRGILLWIKQFWLDVLFESIKFRVLWVFRPSIIEIRNESEVFFQLDIVFLLEVFAVIFCILSLLVTPLFRQFCYLGSDVFYTIIKRNTFTTFQCFGFIVKFFVHVNLRTNENCVVLPHLNHVLCVTSQIQQGLGESSERTFKTLHKKNLHDGCKLLGNVVDTTIASTCMFSFVGRVSKIFNGTIAEIF